MAHMGIIDMDIDRIYSEFDLYMPILTLVVIFLRNRWEESSRQKYRFELAKVQRDEYYKRIAKEKLMDLNTLQKRVEALQLETSGLQEKLGDNVSKSNHKATSEQELKDAIKTLKGKRDHLESIQKKISGLQDQVDLDTSSDINLKDEIDNLLNYNDRLKSQLTETPKLPNTRESDMNKDISNYIDRHEDYTADFFKNAYDTLLDMRASNQELKVDRSRNHETHLTELHVTRKKVDNKFEQVRRQYQDDLDTFRHNRIGFMLKFSGAYKLLEGLRDKNDLVESILNRKQSELEFCKSSGSVILDMN